ncbi:long-chain-fatty-acid--CoA ligase [Aquidulcibacter paucihalophilus]|uniref:long-chain-fatty-acid--CoA ligase n=1 Tax=Aquidulcibacter paucihalophilus TaxID=1978549 RepID=UPI000A18FFC1|nr:long-chain-fatty-acid--CoA ligase [Aquidulcibacter paucihalophilus]
MFDFEATKSVADITRVQAATRPDAIAISFKDRTTTFQRLDLIANQIAHALINLGVKPDDRVAIYGANSDHYIALFFGCVKARATLVGVNARLAPPEVAYVLDDSQAKVFLVGSHFYEFAEKALEHATNKPVTLAIDGGHATWTSYQDWYEAAPTDDPGLPCLPDDDVIQLYTSGTTGLPKGVQITNQNYMAFFEFGIGAQWAKYEAGEAVLIAMPMFHVAGINSAILCIAQGAKAVVLEQVDPVEILRLIAVEKIAHAFVVPAVINILIQVNAKMPTDFSALKRMYYGASPIAEDLLLQAQKTFGCSFTQLYGMTESLGAGTYLPPEAHDPARGKLRSCGIAWPGFEIECRREDGSVCAVGEVGEIAMRSTTIMKGYFNRPEATAATVKDGWLYTGDAGFFDEEGYLYIHDRVKDMIVTGGENVYPAEVENAVFGHPSVADVAVVGVPDEKWGEAVKAIVVLKPGESADPADIIAWTRSRIAGYKVPKSVDFIAELPRNPSGKILRRELREPYWAGHSRRVA